MNPFYPSLLYAPVIGVNIVMPRNLLNSPAQFLARSSWIRLGLFP